MTTDNLIGLITGGVVFPAGLAIFVYSEPFTKFVKALNGRVYGKSRRTEQLARPAFVRVIASAWIVLGLLAIVAALLGGFHGRS